MTSHCRTIACLASVALVSLTTACQQSMWQTADRTEPTAVVDNNDTAQASTHPADREMGFFGNGDFAQNVSFEGKAADNLQQHTTASDGTDFDPHVTPDGQRLIFASTRHSRNSHLYVKPVGGETLTQVTDGPGDDVQPCFSPDGKWIAFASNRAGNWDIWLVDVDGRNLMQITNHPQPELHPSWSPDGKRLVYSRVNPNQQSGELWVVDVENPGLKKLVGHGLFPAWSPSGDKIAYQRARARGSRWFSIWTIDVSNEDALYPTEVASSVNYALIAPSWSGDGAQIAFTAIRPEYTGPQDSMPSEIYGGSRAEIGIIDSDGRGMRLITNGRGENFSPTWSSDDRVFFTAKDGGAETIWSVRPIRPTLFSKPQPTSGGRQAAQVTESDMD